MKCPNCGHTRKVKEQADYYYMKCALCKLNFAIAIWSFEE